MNDEVSVDSTPPVVEPPIAPENPLLARVYMPGSTFTLPSGGMFYEDGELAHDVKHGEVHVQPMTAYDEVLIRTPDLLFSGDAIDKIFKRCIPQILQPNNLFARDVDFLLIALRKVTFGDELILDYKHSCEDAKSHSYSTTIDELIQGSVKIDPTTVGSVYTLNLPNGQVVKLRPARFHDVLGMMQSLGLHETTPEKETERILDTIQGIIRSVDDITDQTFVRQWLEKINAKWIDMLTASIEKTGNWGPTFKTTHECKDCGGEIVIEAPLNPVSFFT